MMKYLMALVLMCATTVSVSAQEAEGVVAKEYNAETMYRFCKGDYVGQDARFQSEMCTFRLQGLILTMVENCMSKEHGFTPSPLLSATKPPSNGAARQAFMKYMENNPAKWGIPWHHAVYYAMSENFPCDGDD